jgi:Ca-activated chloride channel family protein
MKRVVLGAVLVAASLTGQPAPTAPTIRVSVNLVPVIATVRNKTGDLVGTLKKEDFELYDNGVKQEVRMFSRQTDLPLSVTLLVDTSGSTAKDLKYEADSAARFLKAFFAEGNRDDALALYSFNYDIRLEHDFTRSYTALERALKGLHGDTSTSLYDAVYFASRALQERQGRKAIIVVTDGGDTTSARPLKAALKEAQLAGAVIYPIVVVPITNDAGRNVGGENALTILAQGTGGRTFLPAVGAQLDRAFSDIIAELRTQYLLGFYPQDVPLTKDPFHKLEIRLRSAELRVSARNGYYGESEADAGRPGDRISITPERTPPPVADRKKK